jgi:hypothetical protein
MSEATPEPSVSEAPAAPGGTGVLTPGDFHGWLAPGARPDAEALARRSWGQRFKDDGDLVLLLGAVPASLLEPDFTPDLSALPLTLLGLIHEGVVKSAASCAEASLAAALAAGCGPGQGDTGLPPRGMRLDFTAWSGDDLAAALAQTSSARAVISVAATDVGRVIRQARIFGIPALPLGQVGGETVVVKTAAKETTASLVELTMDRFSEVPHATE